MRLSNELFVRKPSYGAAIPSMDGARGVAVLLVVMSHLSNSGMSILPFSFSGSGKYGVYLFFVLSSFLLTLPFLQRDISEIREWRRWANYLIRRVCRIYPLYLIVLLVNYALSSTPLIEFPLTLPDVGQHLVLAEGFGGFWSIPVEFKYYFILPLFVIAVLSLRSRTLVVVPLTLAVAIFFAIGPGNTEQVSTLELTTSIPVFLLGSLVAFVYVKLSRQQVAPSVRVVAEVAAWTSLGTIVLFFPATWSAATGQQVGLDYFHNEVALFGVVWAIFVLASLTGTGLIRVILSSPVLRYIGLVSFSLYLWHVPVIRAVQAILGASMLSGWVSLILAVLFSTLSYLVVERPFLQIRSFAQVTSRLIPASSP